MYWSGILLVVLVALIPALVGLYRTQRGIDARESALALYRGQLLELDRDRTVGLLNEEEHEAARLEVQRRLLVADDSPADPKFKAPTGRRLKPALWIALFLPAASFALYIVNGHPSLPPQPLSERHVAPDAKTINMLRMLRSQVARLSPADPNYGMGHALLGEVEEHEGLNTEAIADWKTALTVTFSPELAIRLAELQSQTDGHISAESLSLYRRALAVAPANAPWRMAVEARIAIGEHEENNGQ